MKHHTGSAADEEARRAAFWVDLARTLEMRDLGELGEEGERGSGYERVAGFNLARIVQGLLLKHGFEPSRVNQVKLAQSLLMHLTQNAFGYDPEITIEAMVDCWDKIVCPEGYDPVRFAVQKANAQKRAVPGEYPTDSQKRNATRIWCVLCELPEDDAGNVYVTMRRLGGELGLDKQTICFAVKALERNKVIAVAFKGGQGIANRYKVLIR